MKSMLPTMEVGARKAGVLLRSLRLRGLRIDGNSGRDIKLAADKASEKLLIQHLKPSGLPVLSEETDWASLSIKSKAPFWVIDPIDGTYNYLRGLSLACVSIALWQEGRPVLGVVYDFDRDEMFSGIADRGAWLNGRLMHASRIAKTQQAVLGTGFPLHTNYSKDGLQNFVESVQRFKKIRMLGSAALTLAYVAAGRLDAYKENGIMLWDVAGGLALVLGAGGDVSYKETAKQYCYDVRVTNGKLRRAHEQERAIAVGRRAVLRMR